MPSARSMRGSLLVRIGIRAQDSRAPDPGVVGEGTGDAGRAASFETMAVISGDAVEPALASLAQAVPQLSSYELHGASPLRMRSRLVDALRRAGFDVARATTDPGIRIVGGSGNDTHLRTVLGALSPHFTTDPQIELHGSGHNGLAGVPQRQDTGSAHEIS